jgi:hypothetical protein
VDLDIGSAEDAEDTADTDLATEDTEDMDLATVLEDTEDMVMDSVDVDSVDADLEVTVSDTDLATVSDTDLATVSVDVVLEDTEDTVLDLAVVSEEDLDATILTTPALFLASTNATLLGEPTAEFSLDMETAISLISKVLISPGITTIAPTLTLLSDDVKFLAIKKSNDKNLSSMNFKLDTLETFLIILFLEII